MKMTIRCGVRPKELDFLEIVDELMDQGLDEETATREAYAQTNPDSYNADDYDNVYSSEDYEEYFGQNAAKMHGDLIADRLSGRTISKRRDTAEEPGGLIYEANELGIDMWDLLEALEGMCREGRAKEIDDSTYQVLGATYADDYDDVYSSEDFEDYEDEIQQVDQEFTSENTSINSGKLPAVFNMVHFEPGTINLDFGGGRFDNVAEYLTQYDVVNLVYDPYNRSKEHNREVIKTIRKAGGADTATCSNVLNVIKEPEARLNVLENIKKLVKPGGTVYITVYEGSGKGNEGPTKSGYQLNRKTADYVEEIQEVFPDAKRKGKLITAINASTSIQASEEFSNNEITNLDASSSEITSKLSNKMVEVLKSPEFGFTDEDIRHYSAIDTYPTDDGRLCIEVRAELSYDGMLDLIELLNPIVESVDSDAYFDMEEPGIATAFIETSSINSAQVIYVDPEDDETYYAMDDVDDGLEVLLNADIIVDEDGEYEYVDDTYRWAKYPGSLNGDWYSLTYRDVTLADYSEVVERIDDLIYSMVPKQPGTYHISGYVWLEYIISGLCYTLDEGPDGEERTVYTDDVEVTYVKEDSGISDFKCEPID